MLFVVLALLLGPSLPPERVVDRHAFYGVYLMGRKVGWAEEHLSSTGPGPFESRMVAHLGVQRAGVSLAMELETTRRYAPTAPHGLIALDERMTGPGSRLHFRGAVREGGFRLEADTGRGWQLVELPEPPRETWQDAVPGLARPDPREGDTFPSVRFDPQLARNVEATNEVVSRRDTLLAGQRQIVVEIRNTEPSTGLVLTSRQLLDGTVLEGTFAGQLRLAREEEAVAKDPAREQLDLFARSIVPASGSLPAAPRALHRVVYRVCGVEAARLAGPWQAVEALPDGCARVTVRRAGADGSSAAAVGGDRGPWLASDARVTATDPAVRRAATAAAGVGPTPDVAGLVAWVHRHVRYALDFNPFNASQVLSEGRGDCSEAALLFVALARALGVPAREVFGLVLASAEPLGFGYHAWAEVAVGDSWLPVDPTWDEVPVNPTHLRFEGEGPYAVLSVFGRLTVQVEHAE